MQFIFEFLDSDYSFKLHDTLISTVLWKWINQVSQNKMTPNVIANLKKYCKDVFAATISKLSAAEALPILNNIFDENNPDKRNLNTPLATVFWEGNTNKDDETTRLGAAYKQYRILNNQMLAEQEKPTMLSQLFNKAATRTPGAFWRAAEEVKNAIASSTEKESARDYKNTL